MKIVVEISPETFPPRQNLPQGGDGIGRGNAPPGQIFFHRLPQLIEIGHATGSVCFRVFHLRELPAKSLQIRPGQKLGLGGFPGEFGLGQFPPKTQNQPGPCLDLGIRIFGQIGNEGGIALFLGADFPNGQIRQIRILPG